MATMDVKDVIGDNLTKILEATAGKKRHAELAEAVNKLVASLQTGAFVVSPTSDLDKRKPEERSAGGGGGLPDDRVADLLVPIRLAMASRSPKIIEATLASVQKLIAHGLLRGDADLPPPARADAAGEEKAAPSVTDSEPSASPPEPEPMSTPERRSSGDDLARASTSVSRENTRRVKADAHAAELVELVCAASDVPDETVELQMLKCLLTAVSSSTFRVRARALLRVVRACVNAYLGSASEVNQTTAKASLTQMLAVVFHRLETRSRAHPDAPPPVIVVADVFSSSLARRGKKRPTTSEESTGTSDSGIFRNRGGVSAAALAAANAVKPTEEDAAAQMTSFVQGFINKVGADLTAVAAAAAGEDTDDIVEWVPASAAAQHREVTEREFDNDGDATPAKRGMPRRTEELFGKERIAYGEDSASDDVSGSRQVSASGDAAEASEAPSASAGTDASAFFALEEDAFLVFRALCKLAKKPGDLTNPAVARGKTLSLELLRILLENAGSAFRRSRRLGAAVSEYLCDAVVVCASQTVVPAAHGLALCAFLAALKNFRHTLKAEIAVFFPALLLDPLVRFGEQTAPVKKGENAGALASSGGGGSSMSSHRYSTSSFQRRAVLLACARELCHDPKLMADVFVNYDCDLDSTNLFERFVEALASVASPPKRKADPGSRDGDAGVNSYEYSSVANAHVTSMTAEDVKLEQSLRLEALECLGVLLESLRGWVAGDCREDKSAEEGGAETRGRADDDRSGGSPFGSEGSGSRDGPETKTKTNAVSEKTLAGIEAMKASKTEYQSAIALFNAKPKKGIEAMQRLRRCGETPEEIASFLKDTPDLDKTTVGDYLGERDEVCLTVMHAYVDAMDFEGLKLDEAIRNFLAGFRLPGESQKIDRLMEKFAERFCVCNPGAYKSADTAYVLAFSVIMLNTDAHNPQVKHKMTKEGFLRNNRGIDDGADVPAAHLEELYDRIVSNEIRMKDEDPKLLAEKAELNAAKSSASSSASQSINRAMKDVSNRLGVDMLMSLMGAQKKTVHEVDTSEFMARVRERAARDAAGFQNVRDPNCAGIMFAQFSRLALCTFRDAFLEVTDENIGSVEAHIVHAALAGYLAAARLAAALHSAETLERCASEAADLAAPNFAFSSVRLNGAETKKPYAFTKKNAEAMRCVVELAKSVGNALDEKCWTHVLVAASRYDKIHSAAAGFDEASLFGGAPEKEARCAKEKRSTPPTGAFGSPWKGGDVGALTAINALNVSAAFKNSPTLANVFGGAGVFGGTNSGSSADESPFAHLKKRASSEADSSVGAFGSPSSGARSVPGRTDAADVNGDEDENVEQNQNPFDDLDSPAFVPPSPAATNATPLDAVSSAYLVSSTLDGDAVVSFTKALCTVSSFELLSSPPRVCSLAKLVEVAHANMDTRTRFVWSKMWAVMSAFFCDACCHATSVEVAMYAADSLRQLATKFLEREELLNYSFQNEFLKPFVSVTIRSQSAPVREFIVRCVCSMISGLAKNVKSGWKSVFAVLTLAACDARRTTAVLAFEIVERVIREHFDRITETDPSVFTDCVDCLIAFTRYAKEDNGADGVVALNAVAFLRFCALKLADGAIGDLEKGVESAAGGAVVGDGDADLRSKEIERADKNGVSRPVARARGATAFTEADAHVFYWFPLLKGLSDLTFDARAEIRRSALEVLFDILDFHGERFSPGFWFEAYHKVLLPIFDRVRFDDENDEKQDEGEDSWVFHTTQRCLDLLVDLTAKRRERILTSENSRGKETLGALFDLFVSLCLTSSKKLASCGVGAMHRLLSSNAADALDEHGWSVAVDALARAMEATKPDVKSLNANGNDADGAFSRKSAASRCAARGETCALLAHAAAETYFARGAVLSAASLGKLVDALLSVATHASASSTDAETTERAATLQTLLALEIESHRALLAVLLHLHAARFTFRNIRDEAETEAEDVKTSGGISIFSDAQVLCGASTRDALVRTAVGILDRFASRIESAETKPTCDSALTPFASAFAPLASDALRALARLDDDAFRAALFFPVNGDFDSSAIFKPRDDARGKDATRKETRAATGFDALTRLTSCASTTRETRAALSDVFQRRVGPLLSRALRRDARA